jgi:hypothetical protein
MIFLFVVLVIYLMCKASLNKAALEILSCVKQERSDLHWYCPPCEEKAMKNLKIEKEVEERCNKYFSKYEKRLDEMENKLDKKVTLHVHPSVLNAFPLVEVTEPLRDMVQISTGLPYFPI